MAPLGWIVDGCSRIRNACYDHGLLSQREPILPVISVGNLTLGGTNKTPFVAFVVTALRETGLRVGIVSRGYSGTAAGVAVISGGKGKRSEVGDEPLLLSASFPSVPVAVAVDRMAAVAALAEEGCDIVVADDAFQHRKMDRDLDIVLVDATCPFGNGRLFPAGVLRERPAALRRADLVVLTKTDLVEPPALDAIKRRVRRYVPEERLFCSRLEFAGWKQWGGDSHAAPHLGTPVWVFSAIGSPDSFQTTLERRGVRIAGTTFFRDHHRYTAWDLRSLERSAGNAGCGALVCTEKDLFNLPGDLRLSFPLWYPRVQATAEDEGRFLKQALQQLRPRYIVASNGYGEDAIGAQLARTLRRRLPEAAVEGFTLVGRGEAYRNEGIPLRSPPAETPSGGVLKYSLRALLQDLRSGLLRQIARQLRAWKALRGRTGMVVCVGDVYLLLHTLWGQGKNPLLVATAKSERLGGYWRLERWLLRRRTPLVWTRDRETRDDLIAADVPTRYRGNPVMDLVTEEAEGHPPEWPGGSGRRVLLLPGSRRRALQDLGLLLETAAELQARVSTTFVMVRAPTISLDEVLRTAAGMGWRGDDGRLSNAAGVSITLCGGSVARAAREAEIVIGLGGTANQVCAGLGLPVVSIREKGKEVQKKLLRDAEVLVPRSARRLAVETAAILGDPERFRAMARSGRTQMGGPGTLDDVADYLAGDLGGAVRCRVFRRLKIWERGDEP